MLDIKMLTSHVRVVVIPFVITRIVCAFGYLFDRKLFESLSITSLKANEVHAAGLFAWDAGYYLEIARLGYPNALSGAVRFFPLYPLVSHLFSVLLHLPLKASLIILSNCFLFVTAVLVYRLARRFYDDKKSLLCVWIFLLMPVSFIFSVGYSDSLFVFFLLAFFLSHLEGKVLLPLISGFLAGLTRPTGIALAIVGVIYFVKNYKSVFNKDFLVSEGLKGLLIASGPVFGTLSFLLYCEFKYHDFLAPYLSQLNGNHRGHFTFPLSQVVRANFSHFDILIHITFAVGSLLVILFGLNKLPIELWSFVMLGFLLVTSSQNLDGLERYIGDLVPFSILLGGNKIIGRFKVPYLVLSGVSLFAICALTYLGLYVP